MAKSFCRRTRLANGFSFLPSDQKRECDRCVLYAYRHRIRWGEIEVLKDTRDNTFHYRLKWMQEHGPEGNIHCAYCASEVK